MPFHLQVESWALESRLDTREKVRFGSDSAAYQAAMINHYSQAGRSFTITADLDQAVRCEIRHLPDTAWQPYRKTEQAFRLIVLRWPNPLPSLFEANRYCYHAVAATGRKGWRR